MELLNLKENEIYLKKYITLCSLEWGSKKNDIELLEYIEKKRTQILTDDKYIAIIGLVDNNTLIGFISLFKYDGNERKNLTPWYATMYVKKEYRGNGYSKILNNAILKEAKVLGYKKVYLKTDLTNYYEKYGAKFIETLNNGENLYYIEIL